MTFHVPNQYRLRHGALASDDSYGNNGAYSLSVGMFRCTVIASDQGMPTGKDKTAWEHVSVRTDYGPPDWATMCAIKALFWDTDDVVMQLHPAQAEYVNFHPDVLHLWRPVGKKIPTPPAAIVGPLTRPKGASS